MSKKDISNHSLHKISLFFLLARLFIIILAQETSTIIGDFLWVGKIYIEKVEISHIEGRVALLWCSFYSFKGYLGPSSCKAVSRYSVNIITLISSHCPAAHIQLGWCKESEWAKFSWSWCGILGTLFLVPFFWDFYFVSVSQLSWGKQISSATAFLSECFWIRYSIWNCPMSKYYLCLGQQARGYTRVRI